jgi:hypothetical protein
MMRLHLQTPRSNRLRFLAGQRATLGLPAGVASGERPACRTAGGELPLR